MMMMATDNMPVGGGVVGGQSLDDIVSHNAKMIRRQSMPQGYSSSPHHINPDMRRVSMMDYASASPSMNGFQYSPNTAMDQSGFVPGDGTPSTSTVQQRRSHSGRRPSAGELSLTTHFGGTSQNYGQMMPPNSAFAPSSAHQQPTSMGGMCMDSSYVDTGVDMSMDYDMNQSLNGPMPPDAMQMHLYNQTQFNSSTLTTPLHASPIHASPNQGTPRSGRMSSSHDQGGGSTMQTQYGNQGARSANPMAHGLPQSQPSRSHSLHVPDMSSPAHTASPMSAPPRSSQSQSSQQPTPVQSQQASHQSSGGFTPQPQNPAPGSREDRGVGRVANQEFDGLNGPVPVSDASYNPNNQNFPWEPREGGWPSTMVGKPHMSSVYKNAYSSTGFDMLGVLVGLVRCLSIESVQLTKTRCVLQRDPIPKSTLGPSIYLVPSWFAMPTRTTFLSFIALIISKGSPGTRNT